MVASTPERILLIGDGDRQVRAALAQAMPHAEVTSVDSYFEGIAELAIGHYAAVLASAEPVERRPEPAIRTLREMAPQSRLVLFGHPSLEPLSRKMLDFGCDDYLITPATPAELTQVFAPPVMRALPIREEPADLSPPPAHPLLASLPLAEILLEAQSSHPHAAADRALQLLNQHLAPALQLIHTTADQPRPPADDGLVIISHALPAGDEDHGQLHLLLPADQDAHAARHFMSRLAELVARLRTLQQRHARLQKLAITDELTGLYNARYFKHFLSRILELARIRRFPVTLLIFDIDNFKRYNDQFGHGVGDEILRETATLMRRCSREHDLVARIGGDEFAVIFWEKEGPRQPKEPRSTPISRTPPTVLMILERFRRALSSQEFPELGASGKGILTISGGLAVYPYDARSADELISAADRELMFKAKQAGKNTIFLVGSDEQLPRQDGV
jgi:two-component system, cell cycle response regulator